MVAQDGPIVKELQDGSVAKDTQAWVSGKLVSSLQSKLGREAEILTPDSPGYKESLIRWSDLVEKPAGLVVFVKSPEDVAACLAFVQEHQIDFAVSGGKHSSSGASSSDGGLVIDLSHMREVNIDLEKKEIYVQGGCIWKDVDEAAGPHDLAMVGGTVNHTGVAGLTLGGGYGWLSGRHGLTVDGLLSAEVVIADGSILTVSDEENADLFWALKGAGHSFAVVTSFTFRAREQKNEIWAGQLVFNPEESLEQIIAFANHLSVVTDGDSGMAMALGPPPMSEKPGIVTTLFFNGPQDKAEALFKPLLELPAIKKDYGLRPYSTMNSILNFAVGYGGRKCTKGGSAITPLNPGFVQNLLLDLELLYKTVPGSRRTMMNIEIFNPNKWSSVPRDATSFFNRGKFQNVVIGPCWEDAQYDDTMRAWGNKISRKFFTEINFRKTWLNEEVAKQDIREYGNYDGNLPPYHPAPYLSSHPPLSLISKPTFAL